MSTNGFIMSEIEPGHAVAYHTMEEAHQQLLLDIRSTYDGPLSIAMDMMTWNITKDSVSERMAVSPDRASAVPGPTRQPDPDPNVPNPMSEFIYSGEWGPGFNAQNELLDAFSKKYGLEDQDWRPAKVWYQPTQ